MLDQKEILSCVDGVPSLSPTVTKIIQLANNVNASANELIQVIKLDPVLTGKVLEMINSVYYGMPQKVVSLGRAVVLLGINTVKNLALSTAVLGSFKQNRRMGNFNMDLFWEHCLGCAVGSKLLAKSKNVQKTLWEEYFIAGLLHDIGKLALVQYAYDDYERVLSAANEQWEAGELALEEKILGTNHAKIGDLIAGKWQLTEPLRESILEHHAPTKVNEEGFSIKTAVYIANIDCNQKSLGIATPSWNMGHNLEILEKVNITEDELDTILMPLEEEVELAKVFLKLT